LAEPDSSSFLYQCDARKFGSGTKSHSLMTIGVGRRRCARRT
jgi:hypothetical protein